MSSVISGIPGGQAVLDFGVGAARFGLDVLGKLDALPITLPAFLVGLGLYVLGRVEYIRLGKTASSSLGFREGEAFSPWAM